MNLLSQNQTNFKTVKLNDSIKTRYYQSGIISQQKIIIVPDLFLPIEYYLPTINNLQNYYVLTYDLISQGESDTIITPTIEQYTKQFVTLIEYLLLDKQRFTIMCHGFGCNIVAYALQHNFKKNIQQIYMFGPQINPIAFPLEKRKQVGQMCCFQPVFDIHDEYNECLFKQNMNEQVLQMFVADFEKYQNSDVRQQFYRYMTSIFDKKSLQFYNDVLPDLLVDKQVKIFLFNNNQFSNFTEDKKYLSQQCKEIDVKEEDVISELDKKYSYLIFINNPQFVSSLIEKSEE